MKTILFDFDKMAGNGSAQARYKIARAFARYNVPTATEGEKGGGSRAVEIDTKIRRVADIAFREVLVMMKDGQRVILRVKRSGDIYQVLVNGKVLPIKSQTDQGAAIREIADALNAGRAQFQKRLSAVRVPVKRGLLVTTRMQVRQLKAKIAGLDVMIEDAQQELADLGVVEATPLDQPEPPPSANIDPDLPADATPPANVAAEVDTPAVVDPPADQWLRDIIDGTTDISTDLKGYRDRVKAALQDVATAELAGEAYKVLGKAALSEANRIVAGG